MTNFEKIKNELENLEEIYPICYIAVHKLGLSRNDGECDDTCCQKCEKEVFKWLLQEYKEPILTEKEKAYLKNVIEPLGVEVRYIKKWKSIAIEENKCCYNIAIAVKHPIMETWERDLMNFAVTKEMPFNRLELDKRYSLKDLGL